jgi:hypothetical protein
LTGNVTVAVRVAVSNASAVTMLVAGWRVTVMSAVSSVGPTFSLNT